MIVLPYPPPELFINRSSGKHWGATYQYKKQAKADAFILASQFRRLTGFIGAEKVRYPVKVTFRPAQLRADLDGSLTALKSALDGVADGLGINDRQFRPMTLDAIRADGKPCVVVDIGEPSSL